MTRHTLAEILRRSGRLAEFKVNPQAFMAAVAKEISRALHGLMLEGIKYEKVAGRYWEHEFAIQGERHLKRKTKGHSPDDYFAADSFEFARFGGVMDHRSRSNFQECDSRWRAKMAHDLPNITSKTTL